MSKKVAIIMGSDSDLPVVRPAITTLKEFLPVIGIPVKSSTLDGLDALLATVQMPSGIPVATVAIDGSANAALLAIQMLALSDDSLAEKFTAYKKSMAEGVARKDAALQEKLKEI